MVVIAIWDTWSRKSPPQLSAGFDQKDALNNNPLCEQFLEDQQSRFHITAFASAEVTI